MAPSVYGGVPDLYQPQFACEAALGRRAAPGPYVQEILEIPQVTYLAPSGMSRGQEIMEIQAPMTYLAPPANTVVEVIRDDAEIAALRYELDDRAQLISDFGRRNEELKQRNAELERLLSDSDSKLSICNGERAALRNNLQSDERALANQEHENVQLQHERDRLEVRVQDLQAKNDVLEAEIQELREQDEELRLVNGEQAQRIVELDDRVAILERELGERQLEIESLLRTNEELEERVREQTAKIAELEAFIDDLQRQPVEEYQPAPAPPPRHHNLSDEDFIDQHIQDFFMTHTDFQMAVNKEKPGLYMFDHPINKKVNMKRQGEKVLARVGGGWQVMEEWLEQERQHFLEAEVMEEHIEEALAPAPAPARPAARAAATAPKAAAKRGAAKAASKAGTRTAAGGARAAAGGAKVQTQTKVHDQF